MKNFWFLFFWGFPLLISGELVWQANIQQPFGLTIKLDSQRILRDELLQLEVIFQYPSSYHLDIFPLLDQLTWSANPLTSLFDLEQWTMTQLPSKEGEQIYLLKTSLSPLATGSLEIPFLTVNFQPQEMNQLPVNLLTPVFTIEVLPIPLTKQEQAYSYAPLIPLTPQFPLDLTQANRDFLIENPQRLKKEMHRNQQLLEAHTFPWLVVFILIGLGGVGWVIYLMSAYWPKKEFKQPSQLTSKEKAEKALKDLQKKHFMEKEQDKFYYAELTTILFTALQEILGLQVTGMTTGELNQALNNQPTLTSSLKEELLSFLRDADQVKFAKKKPSLEEAQRDYQRVQLILEQLGKM